MNAIEQCFELEREDTRSLALENSILRTMSIKRIINTHVHNNVALRITEGLLPDLRRARLLEYANKPECGFVEVLSGNYVSSSYWLLYR